MIEPTLVIMAAGLGSRFGGAKQVTPVDDRGQILIDYSLYDAWRAGFRRAVFVIKEEMEESFRESFGNKLRGFFDVYYVHQKLEMLPQGYQVPEGRVKPWGTGHAVACAAPMVPGSFAVLNADDYYGTDAFREIYQFLAQEQKETEHAMVGYHLRNTVTEYGHVARGICQLEGAFLTGVVERTHIEKRGEDAAYTEDGEHFVPLSGDTLVSMNLWGFRHCIMDELWRRFPAFLDGALEKNPLKAEYFLPSVANAQLEEGLGTIRVLSTDSVWHGVTYREDLEGVKTAIAQMVADGIYPKELWK